MSFKSAPSGPHPTRYALEFVAESVSPVTAFRAQVRPAGAAAARSVGWGPTLTVSAPVANGDHFFAGRLELTGLREGTVYEARVAARNDYGYSRYEDSRVFRFGTLGAGEKQGEEKSKSI